MRTAMRTASNGVKHQGRVGTRPDDIRESGGAEPAEITPPIPTPAPGPSTDPDPGPLSRKPAMPVPIGRPTSDGRPELPTWPPLVFEI